MVRLGELAVSDGEQISLLIVGGGVMVLEFRSRQSTHDLDAVVISPTNASLVRHYSATVAAENDWPTDWLNDAAKGFLTGHTTLTRLFASNGIEVFRPSLEQLLAMKLCAWRDDVDIADATRILSDCRQPGRDVVWATVEPFLQPGRELKAKLAFDDLWDSTAGEHENESA